jgi:VWFA-related protein
MAGRAAHTYLSEGRRPGDLVSVFTVDLALHPLLWFSADQDQIETAVRRAVTQANTESSSPTERAQARQDAEDALVLRDRIQASTGGESATAGANTANNNRIAAMVVQRLELESRNRVFQSFEKLDREQQGYATSRSLQAVVGGLRKLPGRKTLVLFSEGLSTTSATRDKFQALIAEANRSNVAIYAMDVAGLRVLSNTLEARQEIASQNQRRTMDGEGMGMVTKGLERTEDLMQLNPEAGLGDLSDRTGGFLIRDTNNAREAFTRIGEDMRFHYLLHYSPTNDNYDGRFRRVTVRVKRPGVEVHSRDGYLATKSAVPADPRGEAQAFAALDFGGSRSGFAIQAAALSLPDPARPGLVPIIVRVPASAAFFQEGESDPTVVHADLAIVARIRDASGRIVSEASQRYPITKPAVGSAGGPPTLVLYREADLPAGRYTLEAAGYDVRTGRAGVVRHPFEVAASTQSGLRLGSVVLVNGVAALSPEEAERPRALGYGTSALHPNLGEPIKKSETGDLTFYFAALPPKDGPAPGEAVIEILREGNVLRRVRTPIGPPNARGRIQAAAALDLAPLSVGDYELKVTLGQGMDLTTSSAIFSLKE